MRQFEILSIGILFLGILFTIFGFFGLLSANFLTFSFLFLCICFFYIIYLFFSKMPNLNKFELVLINLLILIWSIHFLQVLVPETGFDALWYHLPVIKEIFLHQKIIYIPEIYQSVNPLFSDLYFLTGYAVFGSVGTKFIAYIFATFLVISVYRLSKVFLNRRYALLVVLLVSVFQVIAWQSSSFYIDIPKAFFEIVGLYFLTSNNSFKNKMISLLFVSASMATKLFSVVLAPLFLYFSESYKKSFLPFVISLCFLFFIPFSYYYFSYINTGIFFYSFSEHFGKLSEIGGQSNLLIYVFYKIISIPKSIYEFIFAKDYINPLLIIFFLPIIFKLSEILKNIKLKILFLFSSYQWILWWIIPPLSTRYSLSGFITITILGILIIKKYYLKTKFQRKIFWSIAILSVVALLIPRIMIARRSLYYIIYPQTTKEYLEKFYDGSIDEKINNWYF